MRAPQVFIETFGCQMNEYDTELVRSILKDTGYRFTDSPDTADVVLLNTCAIRENAHNKVQGHLGALKSLKETRGLVIGVLGCMAQNLKKDLLEGNSLIDVRAGIHEHLHDAGQRLDGLHAAGRRVGGQLAVARDFELFTFDLLGEHAARMLGFTGIAVEEYQSCGKARVQLEA